MNLIESLALLGVSVALLFFRSRTQRRLSPGIPKTALGSRRLLRFGNLVHIRCRSNGRRL